MLLRLSNFAHLLPIGEKRVLIVHAVSHLRLLVDREVERLLAHFQTPQDLQAIMPGLCAELGYDLPTLAGSIGSLIERGVLTDKSPEAELASISDELSALHGRDPGALLDRYRRQVQEGANPYWAVASPHGVGDLAGGGRRIDIILIGDCELQMEADFLRREAARRGIDLRVTATFPDDVRVASERAHDLLIVGALRTRGTIAEYGANTEDPSHAYIAEARWLLDALRQRTPAPILIDNLPEPTVQPLGFADRGPNGHRNRFRQANMALERLVADYSDVHVVDIAAVLAAAGSERLLDDGLVSFTHFGAPGWMLQRPESEKAACHGLFPDATPLAAALGGNPYERETVAARAHVDALVTVLGVDRKKCAIVDLDGVLWPGVLAETGRPFDWHPEVSSANSFIGLYFGIHEALKALKRRGILLACVSKNDESTVRELWTYPDHYPRERLLQLEDFVTWRINWEDKSDNIVAIADELGLALDTFIFVDDNPVERERVRLAIPEIAVFGEDLFALRRQLLDDPRLQLPYVTAEASVRTDLVKAQLQRARLRAEMPGETEFRAHLDIKCSVETLSRGASVDRIAELFQRTTQFNTTGRKFSVGDLNRFIDEGSGWLFSLKASDRFGDHGLVAAAVVSAGEIVGFVMSCRVIGLGLEHRLIDHILAELASSHAHLVAQIVPTSRNFRVRNLYRDHGFTEQGNGLWSKPLEPIPDDRLECSTGPAAQAPHKLTAL